MYYDKDWVLTKHMEDAVYTVSVVLDEIMTPDWQGCQKAQVIARAEEAEIFRVPVKKYVG